MPQFRRFGSRLLLLIVGLIAIAQVSDYVLVVRANRRNAVERIHDSLYQGASLFKRRVDARLDELSGRAALMSDDYSIRQLFLNDQPDAATVRSALASYSVRMGVPFMTLLTPDGARVGDTGGSLPGDALRPFQDLVKVASASDELRADGFARLPAAGPGGKLYALLVVPIYAPRPEVVAWIGLALPIDRAFATGLKSDARLEITFYYSLSGAMEPVESTLPADDARRAAPASLRDGVQNVGIGADSYVTIYTPLPLITPGTAAIALQRSLEAELAPSLLLERFLLVLLLASLGMAALVAPVFAQSLSRPLRALAAHTEVIARGDYQKKMELNRADEIGQLAGAFNRMSDGLAERDRVRDLLDKNVSPDVAAQLLKNDGALGGEEREVTVLFVDLRSFTRTSERLPPKGVLELLNRFFDRMSGIVETHHGIVDKYIGDAIMALFGAPLDLPGQADSALRAALEMQEALARLNADLEAEGRTGLAVGIGINTSKVIAGNIGSSRRLNYSVVGDGVNVAARLQDMTRRPEFNSNLLVSAATLKAARGRYQVRSLGALQVRGRDEPIEVFAVDGELPGSGEGGA